MYHNRVGTVIDGKYEVLKQIGKGGMSVVYLAMDGRLNKQWAIKEIRKKTSDSANQLVIQSLLAEANLMKRLDHPALPRIVDIIDTGETIYIVMDYIEGEPLDRIVKEFGAQPQELVIDWAKQLCEVLAYLHAQQPPIIYRDMKPSNIMLKPEGNLKVIDFGIAREYKEANSADTVSLGTRGYAAPEQFGGQGQTDARTDIYGLGVTLYHLVTGHNPGDPPYEIVPIREWNAALSGGLERIVEKCTQANPADRYQNCAELMYALEHYEEEDDAYRGRQKKRLAQFGLFVGLAAVMLGMGLGGRSLTSYENSRDYDIMVGISASTEYETRLETYREAIALIPDDPRAYLLLLDAYTENGTFAEEQSNQFAALYNRNRHLFDETDPAIMELNYQIGLTYFYRYTGGDNAFRTRLLKAFPFFAQVHEAAELAETPFDLQNMAEGYYLIGSFYNQYVVQSTSVREPGEEAYEELLAAFWQCIESIEDYDLEDAAYSKLSMYGEIANLLNEHRMGFAATGVEMEAVLALLEAVEQRAYALAVTQTVSIEMRESILSRCADYRQALQRSYENAERRR